jgi:hypothetical protein
MRAAPEAQEGLYGKFLRDTRDPARENLLPINQNEIVGA